MILFYNIKNLKIKKRNKIREKLAKSSAGTFRSTRLGLFV
jgi:hypothetical protein